MPKASKIRIIKTPKLGYRGHAEPDVGVKGVINDECRKIQKQYGPELKDPTWVYIRFKPEDLGYESRERNDWLHLWIPPDCFEVIA